MNALKTATIALLSASLAVGSTLAEDKKPAGEICKASDFQGMTVKNPKGEELGDVEDVVIDTNTGEIVYVAIAVGETLDLGGKFFAVDPRALTANKEFVGLDVSRAQLERSKGFNKDAWPNEPDRTLGARDREEKAEEGVKEAGKRNLKRVSQLMDATVYGGDNKKLGEVDGIAYDKANHKVAYMVLGYGGFADVGEEFFAIPCSALSYKTQNNTFTMKGATESTFKGQKGFDKDNWPTQADQRFAKKTDSDE